MVTRPSSSAVRIGIRSCRGSFSLEQTAKAVTYDLCYVARVTRQQALIEFCRGLFAIHNLIGTDLEDVPLESVPRDFDQDERCARSIHGELPRHR